MDITVTDAILHGVENGPNVWVLNLVITPHDGRAPFSHTYVMPEDITERRTAEYDLDPRDPAAVLEGILYEPWLPAADTTNTHPHGLWRAPDITTARNHYLDSIRRHRGNGVVTDRNRLPGEPRPSTTGRPLLDNDDHPATPLAMLIAELTPHPGRVAVLREHVTRARAAAAAAVSVAPTDAQLRVRPTPAQLAESLTPQPPRPQGPSEATRT